MYHIKTIRIRRAGACSRRRILSNFAGTTRKRPLIEMVRYRLFFAKFGSARAGVDFLRKRAPFCLLRRHFPCQGNYPPLRFVVHCSVAPQSIMPRCLPCSRVLRYRQNLLFLRVLHPRQFPLFPLPSALQTASSPFHPRKCASRAHPWTGAQTR